MLNNTGSKKQIIIIKIMLKYSWSEIKLINKVEDK